MLNFFIGFAFFEFGALCGFFVAALMQAARDGGGSAAEECGRSAYLGMPWTGTAETPL